MRIHVKDISKIYGTKENQVAALQHVSMTISEGDFISIMGPSGSGKSTFLHLVSGLDKPSSGQVFYDKTDIHHGSDKELSTFRRQKIGFIFQQFNLIPVLTARENIVMPVLLDKKEVDEGYLKELSSLLGLEKRMSHLPCELSGGQQQRVAIARALIAKPDVIFADEPTGNLDSKSGSEVMKILCEIREKMNKTVVIITHDSKIAEMAERRFTIMDGELMEVSRP
ncbi:MAG: ABC transporter ATP-binding protein [Blautia sp.]|uniref:ABC transporter ATP-binding protein n=1 Tax=Blautia sp. TaxID=1955243 RepID=UPI002E76B170|nr:ABC transporter ATP-binding protein [Blautia sp.]MEE1443725.1 ABC transporter ATP-binding protein [Blautia sp.]